MQTAPAAIQRTPLHDVHVALSAKLVEFGGWMMPVQYGPILDEVRTVRSTAGLFDLSHMGRVVVRGKDRVAYLDRICTNHVAKIPQGSIRYSLFCKDDGMPIDDLLVYQGVDEVFLCVNASNTAVDLAWMREHAKGFDVSIEDQTQALAMIAVQGQESGAILQPFCAGLELAKLGYYKFGFGAVCGIEGMRVSRTGYTGELGYELYVPRERVVEVWNAVLAAGAPRGLRPIGLGARDTLRLEAGMPLYGHELTATTDPFAIGLGLAFHFEAAGGEPRAFPGSDAFRRMRDQAAPQVRVGIVFDSKRSAREGAEVRLDGRPVGRVTSGSYVPTVGSAVAMALVDRAASQPGTAVDVMIRDAAQPGRVAPLPFHRRPQG